MTAQHDHAEITLLVDRFFRALDERTFASGWTDAFLTEDSGMETPLGTFHGAEPRSRIRAGRSRIRTGHASTASRLRRS
ncbi:nuclear transport factor 2 family protein, partial [Streptomyces sp. NPDC001215]